MMFVVILRHVVRQTQHQRTSYSGSARTSSMVGTSTAESNFILISSACLEGETSCTYWRFRFQTGDYHSTLAFQNFNPTPSASVQNVGEEAISDQRIGF